MPDEVPHPRNRRLSGVPKFLKYHQTLSDEFESIKDRVRDLVEHWPTDGAWKEVALRNVLRRYLPETVTIGTGFVVTESGSSTQIDILIVDADKPTLFKDGELLIVTPDAVRAAIEVKTSCRKFADVSKSMCNLLRVRKACRDQLEPENHFKGCWAGMFIANGAKTTHEQILKLAHDTYAQVREPVDCISCGKSTFVRYYPSAPRDAGRSAWYSYELPKVSPSFFIGNLLRFLSPNHTAGYAWFPLVDEKSGHRGKQEYRRFAIDHLGSLESIQDG